MNRAEFALLFWSVRSALIFDIFDIYIYNIYIYIYLRSVGISWDVCTHTWQQKLILRPGGCFRRWDWRTLEWPGCLKNTPADLWIATNCQKTLAAVVRLSDVYSVYIYIYDEYILMYTRVNDSRTFPIVPVLPNIVQHCVPLAPEA